MKITSWLLFLFFVLAAACTSRLNRQQDEQFTAEQFDSLSQVYYSLYDSLKASWLVMMEDDNRKLADMEMLLNELDTHTDVAADTLVALRSQLRELRLMRYDSLSVRYSERIDRYDSMTTHVSEALIGLTDSLQAAEVNPVMGVLRDKIVTANNGVLLYRIRYDSFAEDFNRFLERYKSVMAEIDSSGLNARKQPMFRLINDFDEPEKKKK